MAVFAPGALKRVVSEDIFGTAPLLNSDNRTWECRIEILDAQHWVIAARHALGNRKVNLLKSGADQRAGGMSTDSGHPAIAVLDWKGARLCSRTSHHCAVGSGKTHRV